MREMPNTIRSVLLLLSWEYENREQLLLFLAVEKWFVQELKVKRILVLQLENMQESSKN